MKFLNAQLWVLMFKNFKSVHYSFRRIGFNRRESGYIDPCWVEKQYFYKDTYIFWRLIRVSRVCLFSEEIPVWAWSSHAALGYTEWGSACPSDVWLLCTGKVKQ